MTTFISTITADATSHVLNTLSTLYTNPPFAVMREFIANGIDAHTDAGYDGPVEVTVPTADSQVLVIRDHGKGMSRDTLMNVYYNYGESTKRGDGSKIGSFGLGSKSAYALSPTWELTSVTATEVIHVVSSINEQGLPSHTMSEKPNDGTVATGVTVSIPSSGASINQFREESRRLLTWLPIGSVKLTVEPLGYASRDLDHWTERTVRNGKLAFPLSFRTCDAQVVLGGIPYRADLREVHSRAAVAFRVSDDTPSISTVYGPLHVEYLRAALSESNAVVVLDDSKALDVTTSRDDVKMTPRSMDVLTALFVNELNEAVTFLSNADGSLEYLEGGKKIPLVGLIMQEMMSRRGATTHATSLLLYSKRKNVYYASVTDFTLYKNLLWRKYPPTQALVVTDYPKTMPSLQLLERVAREFSAQKDNVFITHDSNTGCASLDAGIADILPRNGIKFVTWEQYRERVSEIRRRDRAGQDTPAPAPVEGVILKDHKVVERFSVELGKMGKLLERNSGVPLYFSAMWGDADAITSRLPRGFSGIIIRSLMDTRRDNLLAARHGVLPSAELNKLTVNENNIAAVRALPAKQRRAVLDHLDIESRNGVDYAAVKEVYENSIRMGNVLAGSHFTKAVESCEIGRRILSSRDSGLRRYSMDSGAILSALRKDSDRFYTRYPLLTIVNLSRSSAHKDALDALVQYIKSVESA